MKKDKRERACRWETCGKQRAGVKLPSHGRRAMGLSTTQSRLAVRRIIKALGCQTYLGKFAANCTLGHGTAWLHRRHAHDKGKLFVLVLPSFKV